MNWKEKLRKENEQLHKENELYSLDVYKRQVSMMYMQAFQQLYDRAEREYGGRLPRHVRFIMDEFYNTPPPDRFDNVLSTCRSYNL